MLNQTPLLFLQYSHTQNNHLVAVHYLSHAVHQISLYSSDKSLSIAYWSYRYVMQVACVQTSFTPWYGGITHWPPSWL